MNRTEAKKRVAALQLRALSLQARRDLLEAWYPVVASLAHEAGHSVFEFFCERALVGRLRGVTNEYLSDQLSGEGVEGVVEPMERCVCCDSLSLVRRFDFEICPVCFWEDVGDVDLDVFIDPNRMTLREAKKSFRAIGAVSSAALPAIQSDGRQYLQG